MQFSSKALRKSSMKSLNEMRAENTTGLIIPSQSERIKAYTITELFSLVTDEKHLVRDECLRRHKIAERKLVKVQQEIARLELLAKQVM